MAIPDDTQGRSRGRGGIPRNAKTAFARRLLDGGSGRGRRWEEDRPAGGDSVDGGGRRFLAAGFPLSLSLYLFLFLTILFLN